MARRLIEQSLGVAGIRVVGAGLGLTVSVAIARVFGRDVFGAYGFCVAVMSIAAVPVSNGWATMMLRYIARRGVLDRVSECMWRRGVVAAVALAGIASILGWCAIEFGQSDWSTPLQPAAGGVAILLFVVLLSDQIAALRMACIRGVDRPVLAQIPETVIRPTALLIGIGVTALALQEPGTRARIPDLFLSLAAAAALSATVGHLILGTLRRPQDPGEGPAASEDWIPTALTLAWGAGLAQAVALIDLLFLGALSTAGDLGSYRAAVQIATLSQFGYMALNMLAGQRFPKLLAADDLEGLASTARQLALLAAGAALPIPILLVAKGELVFSMMFGPSFTSSAPAALIISIGFLFSAMAGMPRTLLIMAGMEVVVIRSTLAALGLNASVCFALIPRLGIMGAATANLTSAIALNAFLWHLARKHVAVDTSVISSALPPPRSPRAPELPRSTSDNPKD